MNRGTLPAQRSRCIIAKCMTRGRGTMVGMMAFSLLIFVGGEWGWSGGEAALSAMTACWTR